MKRILVTTDLSEESTAAFPVAAKFADAFHASIMVLTVMEDPTQAAIMPTMDVPLLPPIDVQPALKRKAEADLEALVARHFAGRQCEWHVQEGAFSVAGEIVAFAQSRQADMIVMTTHGRRGFSHMLIGSITEKVMQQATMPVVAVPLRGVAGWK